MKPKKKNDPQTLLISVAHALNKLHIPYLVTGGMSVVVWGRPRFTADIDMVLGMEPHELEKFIRALKKLGPAMHVDEEAIREAYQSGGECNVIESTSGVKVDFWIVRKADPFSASRLARRVARRVAGVEVYFSSAEDLILSKLQWRKDFPSDRQMEDIKSVIAVSGPSLDWGYLEEWAGRLGLQEEIGKLKG